MRILVQAKPNSKREYIKKVGNGFVIAVKEAPTNGKANVAIERKVAECFDVPYSRVRILSGHASHQKVFEVDVRMLY